jgi:outer membrane protein assembly factor BamB
VGSGDDKVYALDAETGKELWSYATRGDVASSPTVAGQTLYVGSYDGNLYALNTLDGSLLWKYTTDDMVVSSPAVVNGLAYVGSYDHLVYAIGSLTQDTELGPEQSLVVFVFALVLGMLVVSSFGVFLYRRKRRVAS